MIQAGFSSRLAAIKAVTDTGAAFQMGQELRQWLNSEAVAAWNAQADWPTAETKAMWTEFTQSWTLSVISQRSPFSALRVSSSAGFTLLFVVTAVGATFWAVRWWV